MGDETMEWFRQRLESAIPQVCESSDASSLSRDLSKILVAKEVIYLSAPTDDSRGRDTELISFGREAGSGHLRARSIKPANIIFNLPSLLRVAASGMLAIAGALSNPMLLVAAVLLVIADTRNVARIDFSRPLSYVLKAIWELRYLKATQAKIGERANLLLASDCLPTLDETNLTRCLKTLKESGCVDIDRDGVYRIVESVRVTLA